MAITFSNSIYEREHETKPRGFGKWAFLTFIQDSAFTRENCPLEHYKTGRYTIVWASDVMTLTEAKKQFKTWLLEHGYKNELIYVAD